MCRQQKRQRCPIRSKLIRNASGPQPTLIAIWIDSEAGKAKNNGGVQSQCSSAVEQRFRKPSVAGSIPAIGSISRNPARVPKFVL